MASLYFADQKAQRAQDNEGEAAFGVFSQASALQDRQDGASADASNTSSNPANGRAYDQGYSNQQTTDEKEIYAPEDDHLQGNNATAAPPDLSMKEMDEMPTANVDYVGPAVVERAPAPTLPSTLPSTTPNDQTTYDRNTPGEDTRDKNSRCLLLRVASLCCILILGGAAAGAGVALSNRGGDKKGATGASNDESKTTVPTISPTPSPSNLPTLSPTSVNRPPNDGCTDATPITPGSTIEGTSIDASADPDVLDGQCGYVFGDGDGVWYQTIGNGLLFTASTCEGGNPFETAATFDTKISVYVGTCGGNLQCIDFNDDDARCGTLSSVDWDSRPGETYYILVSGYDGGAGNFSISLEETPLLNDGCEGAISLPSDGSIMVGSTLAATEDGIESCNEVEVNSPGVWYTFVGTGETLILTTCFGTAFDTQLTLFAGTCGALECVNANDDSCGQQSSIILENSVEGQVYYLFVHGFFDTGPFGISVATSDTLYNNFCVEARGMEVGTTVTGTTEFATFGFNSAFTCFENTVEGPNVWYTVVGTGGPLVATLCEPETDYDTQLTILSGECDGLNCVASNDDSTDEACDLKSTVEWDSEFLVTYYVLVHGFGNSTGNFGLSVSDPDQQQANIFDSCASAGGPFPLNQPSVVSMYQVDATVDAILLSSCNFPAVNNDSTLSGSWYYVVGDGGEMNATWCDNADANVQVAFFQGDCDALACVDGVQDTDCTFTWQTQVLEQYTFFVSENSAASDIDYSITLSSAGPPTPKNDECSTATALELGALPLFTTTVAASLEAGFTNCGDDITAPGVWFSVDPGTESKRLTASLCSYDGYDTRISVFNGTCDGLTCVGGNDDTCRLQSAYTWLAQANEIYYILVHGFRDSTGIFGVEVFEEIS